MTRKAKELATFFHLIFSDYFKKVDGREEQNISVAYVNEVIKDISEKNAGTLNIIMTDEMMPDSRTASKVDEKSVKMDWTSLDIDKQNIFILAAFNTVSIIIMDKSPN